MSFRLFFGVYGLRALGLRVGVLRDFIFVLFLGFLEFLVHRVMWLAALLIRMGFWGI